ncbi:MAG TPA: ATP-binding protein, partial [Cyclobacteriaceae bacterium]|nr:ATP-binding protein [Cyclobacteriaceae bacterium]
ILLSMSLAQILSPEAIPSTAITLWIRNTVGILLFSPLILSFYKLRIGKITQKRLIESAIFITSSLLVIWLFKIPYLQYVAPFALSFVAIPFLLWLAFRFKGTVAIVGYVMVAIIAIYNTSLLKPPFYQENFGVESILLLQLYLIMIASSSLILASAVYERKQAQSDLRRFNENLESIVLERTQALKNEIQNRKEIQRKVELTNEELKKRNTELDNFVYSVSHDLRAPIASILGLINILKKEKKPDDIKMYIELMEKSAKQQDYFIREILDQSRNARLEVKSEPVQFNELIEETFEQLDYSNLNGNKFKKKIHINQEQPFYCDKWRLKVILNNIISNAIRYKNGKEPIIQVEVNIIDHKLQLSIADNGKGIGKHHLPNLGKMFYRATDKGAGSGLGLYIVKETVHKLNGSFFIDSEEGIGTTVKFEIPELAIHDN